ncbi:MAG TPA: hypothetical protein VHP34_04790 [Alphaproteobacteria bacterium]|nr:hypothetical protein [Alphaproteobacteria bacterium]
MAPRRPKIVSTGIPDLPEEELVSRAFKVKQIGKASDGKLHYVESVHIDRVRPDRGMDVESSHVLEAVKGLKPLLTMTTTHRSVMPAYFMPRVTEVLAQIPAELLDQVTAYSVEYEGKGDRANTDSGRTTLYTGKLPDHISSQMVVLNGKVYKPPEPPPEPQDIPVMKPIRFKPRAPGM